MHIRKSPIILTALAVLTGAAIAAHSLPAAPNRPAPQIRRTQSAAPSDGKNGLRPPDTSSNTAVAGRQTPIRQAVPFVVQAPFANWNDPRFENGCEEASIIMAMGWINNIQKISPQEAQDQILDITAFEDNAFGFDADTDVFAVQKIFKEHFQKDVSVEENITLADLKDEIEKGNIALVPSFGRALHNPYYSSPGPITHMLAVIGYDPDKKEFITNDPGTKRGAGYRYGEKILFDSIWEYPSGKDLPPPPAGNLKKAVIIVTHPK